MRWLIATDLDGTLLDDRYALDEAAAAVDAVGGESADVRVVLVSSKTAREMAALADRCTSDPIWIFENGTGMAWRLPALNRRGAMTWGGYEMDRFGQPYAELRDKLEHVRRNPRYRFRGFTDMTAAEVAALTGLNEDAAAAARERNGSEPILWHGDAAALAAFRAELAHLDLTLERGGQFYHVMSRVSKARAIERVKRLFWRRLGFRVTTLACGNAPNDLEMLERADYALVFPDAGGGYLLPESTRVTHAPEGGPQVWLTAVSRVIDFQTRRVLAL